jgi:hypothetical protein
MVKRLEKLWFVFASCFARANRRGRRPVSRFERAVVQEKKIVSDMICESDVGI